jgi:hypothetical protein
LESDVFSDEQKGLIQSVRPGLKRKPVDKGAEQQHAGESNNHAS